MMIRTLLYRVINTPNDISTLIFKKTLTLYRAQCMGSQVVAKYLLMPPNTLISLSLISYPHFYPSTVFAIKPFDSEKNLGITI